MGSDVIMLEPYRMGDNDRNVPNRCNVLQTEIMFRRCFELIGPAKCCFANARSFSDESISTPLCQVDQVNKWWPPNRAEMTRNFTSSRIMDLHPLLTQNDVY